MDISKEQLIELITKEVISALNGETACFRAVKNALPNALVIGNIEKLPDIEKRKYNFYSLEKIADVKDMSRFDKVFVETLTLTELADIALGRDEGNVQKAVIGALLLGKEVAILDSALPHKQFAYRANRSYYQVYEEYVRKLKAMNIRFITGKSYYNVYAKNAMPDPDIPEGIITESVARVMVMNCVDDVIKIKRGSVITPSAYDVFNAAGKKTIIE